MGKVLEAVVRELSPLHDFDRFKFLSLSEIGKGEDGGVRIRLALSNFKFLLWYPKHIIRGALYGAALAGMFEMLQGDLESYDELYRALAVGGRLGYELDTAQYMIRGAYLLLKRDMPKKEGG